MRQAAADAKREMDEYRAMREARLKTAQPEAQALDAKVHRVTAETDRAIAALEAEYSGNKEKVLQLVMQVVMVRRVASRCAAAPTSRAYRRSPPLFPRPTLLRTSKTPLASTN